MSKALTIVKEEKIKLLPQFNTARKHIANIVEHGRRMQHESVLLGLELNRLKDTVGVKHGGDHTSAKASCHGDNFIPWDELVLQQTGYSYETCNRWMKIAKGAQKSIPLLTAKDVLNKPFHKLPQARQTEIVKTLQKAVDGHTMAELAVTFGVCKPAKANTPPKATKESAAKRNSNANDEALAMQQLIELSEGHITAIEEITLAEAFKALGTDRLAAFENAVDALLGKVSAELKTRRKGK